MNCKNVGIFKEQSIVFSSEPVDVRKKNTFLNSLNWIEKKNLIFNTTGSWENLLK